MTHVFALPITQDTVAKIKDGLWAPLNITEQWSINKTGECIEKKRLTHDQCFDGLESGVSINDKIDEEKLETLIYCYIFLRLIHMIHAMRMCYPFMVILIYKHDLDSAYCCMHMNAASAAIILYDNSMCPDIPTTYLWWLI